MSSLSVTEQARRTANLRLLQRTCSPQITDILVSATHVVLYEYRDNAWFKSGIEGSLFVVQKTAGYTLETELIVLNRHSADNFQISVSFSFQLQLADPYLIFQDKSPAGTRIRGVWFHSADERNSVHTALQQTLQIMQQHAQAAATAASPPANYTTTAAADASKNQQQVVKDDDASAAVLATLFSPLTVGGSGNQDTTAAMPTAPTPLARAASTPSTRQTLAANNNKNNNNTSSHQVNDAADAYPPPVASGVALDKKSLQLALLSLIQDDRFLDLLHSQYLRVVHARAKKQDKK